MQETEKTEVGEEESKEPKKFSDVYGQDDFEFPGEQVNEKDIHGKEMTIYGFGYLHGQWGKFAVVDAELTEEITIDDKAVKRIQFAEGSEVILKQLQQAKEDGNLPIIAKIEERTSGKSKMTYKTLA